MRTDQLTSERYPNGLVASTTYDATGAATSLKYTKVTGPCGSSCLWLEFQVQESIHGQAAGSLGPVFRVSRPSGRRRRLCSRLRRSSRGSRLGLNARARSTNSSSE